MLSHCAPRFRCHPISRLSKHYRLHKATYSTTMLPQHTDLLDRYRALVTAGEIQYDEEQIRVVMQLRRLQRELADYSPAMVAPHLLDNPETSSAWWINNPSVDPELPTTASHSIVSLRSHAEELANLKTPQGLLLTGPPGSGKSFLVDLWLSCIPTPYKTRKHYNELVLEIYRGVWEETQRRMADNRTRPGEFTGGPWNKRVRDKWRDLITTGSLPVIWRPRGQKIFTSSSPSKTAPTVAFSVARRLLLRHWLLVFDEFQLLDISSATLLADVLSWYWRMGGVIVGTSNKIPDDIYKHGVQRERLEPFVEALKVRCPVLTMRSEHDWRRVDYNGIDQAGRTWFLFGQEPEFLQQLKSFAETTLEARSYELSVFGRRLHVPWSSGGVGQFTFSELCDESLGPADYITVAAHFHTIGIAQIPVLKLASKNQARRFISLIDALYEARCRVVGLAETKPEALFFSDTLPDEINLDDVMMAESITETQENYRPNVSAYNTPSMSHLRHPVPAPAMALDTLSIFSGLEEQFAFKRALSRLIEMTSPVYARTAKWVPLLQVDRPWEKQSPHAATSHTPSNNIDTPSSDEFGCKAANESSNYGKELERPAAPRLNSDHVWGVRDDWGRGSNTWGKGARAYEEPESTHKK
ncbi:AFG1-like ATPase-domain-containing protein [Mycena rebaudengoi]|nr:AFG1-like ATPase-domain-containing protein [Mycena rebaudengoi]